MITALNPSFYDNRKTMSIFRNDGNINPFAFGSKEYYGRSFDLVEIKEALSTYKDAFKV